MAPTIGLSQRSTAAHSIAMRITLSGFGNLTGRAPGNNSFNFNSSTSITGTLSLNAINAATNNLIRTCECGIDSIEW